MSKKPKRSQPVHTNRREAEMDYEDFVELRSRGSNKNSPKKRRSRTARKSELRDALTDPDALEELMDEN